MYGQKNHAAAALLIGVVTMTLAVSQVQGQHRAMAMRMRTPTPMRVPMMSRMVNVRTPFFAPQATGFNRFNRFGRFDPRVLRAFRLGQLSANGYGLGGGLSGLYGGGGGYGGGGSYGGGTNMVYVPYSATSYSSPYGDDPAQNRAFVDQEKLANRRRAFDEYLYEREQTPSPSEERQRAAADQLDRSLNDPPFTEVLSGKALNDILRDLRKLSGRSDLANPDPSPVLDPDVLRHINVTAGRGTLGLLKEDGRLHWPIVLSGADYREERERLNAFAPEALHQARGKGRVDAALLEELTTSVDRVRHQLVDRIRDVAPSQYIAAKAFLQELDEAIKALEQPDAGRSARVAEIGRAGTVAELIQRMTAHGVEFAAANRGDEAAYGSLHQALASYDRAVHALRSDR